MSFIFITIWLYNSNRSSADVVTIFVFVNAIAMLVSGIQFGKLEKWTYYFALVVVAAKYPADRAEHLDLSFWASFSLTCSFS